MINLKISRIIFSVLIAFVLLFSSSVILSNAQVGFFEESFPTGTAPIAVAVDEINKRSYVVNSGSNSVTSIDTGPLVVLTPSISVGNNPKDISIHIPNGLVYVTNFGSDTVSVIDEFSDTVIETITVGNGPDGIEVLDFIDRAFVVNTLDNSVSVINTFENTVVATITDVGSSPEKMITAFTGPSSEKLYVTSAGNDKIIIITRTESGFTESYAVTGEITGLSGTPTDLAFDFSSNTLYAAITTASNVADVIDVIDVSGTPSVGTPITVGFGAHGLAIDEFAQFLYVTNRDSPSISVINTQTNIVDTTLTDTAVIGFEPVGIFIDQFFSEIHVTDFTGNTLQVLLGEGETFIDATFTGVLDQFFVSAFQSGTTSNPIKLTINSPTAETLHVFVGGLGIGMKVEFQTDCSGGFSDGSVDEIQISVLASTNKDVCIRFTSATSTPPGSYFAFIDVENFETGEFIGLGLDIPVTPAASFGPSIFLSPFTALPDDTVTVFATGFVSTSSCILAQDIISNELFSDAGSCFDGSGAAELSFVVPNPNTLTGFHPIILRDGSGNEAVADVFYPGGSDTFSISATQDFIPPISQGTDDSSVSGNTFTVNVELFSGNTFDPNPIVTLHGLPNGVTAKFDSGTFSSEPSTILTGFSTGGTKSTIISFKVDDYAQLGPMQLFVEAVSDLEIHGVTLFTGVFPSATFFDFGDSCPTCIDYNPFDFGTLIISPKDVSAGDVVTISASGFGTNNGLTPTPELTLFTFSATDECETPITIPSTAVWSSGSLTTTVKIPTDAEIAAVLGTTCSSLPSGISFIELQDGGSRFAEGEIFVIGANDVFTANAPDFLPPIQQGQKSSSVTITIQAISGKDAGTVTATLNGLPKGVTASFDGSSFASPLTKSFTVGTGTVRIDLVYKVSDFAPVGPIFGDLFLSSTGGTAPQTTFLPIDTGILPGNSFTDFSDDAILCPTCGNLYNVAQVIMNPSSGSAGSSVQLLASGFTPNAEVVINFSGAVIPLPTGTTFDQFGSFSQTIKIPKFFDASASLAVAIAPGFNLVQVSETGANSNGNVAFSEFFTLSASDLFTFTLSPRFTDPIVQPTSGTASSSDIKLSAVILPGRPQTTVDFIVEHLPPGFTITFDDASNTDTVKGDAVKHITISSGSKQSTSITVNIDDTVPPGHYFIPIRVEDNNSPPKTIFWDGIDIGVIPSTNGGTDNLGRLSLSPNSGKQGTPVTISGSGFTGGNAVSLSLGGEPLPLPPGTIFDPTGFWSVTMNVPNDVPPGTYSITLSDGVTKDSEKFNVLGASETFQFFITPEFLSPIQAGTTVHQEFVIQVDSLLGQDAPITTITVEGYDTVEMDVQYSEDGGTTWKSFDGNTLTLDAGQGKSDSAIARIVTNASTPPTSFQLFIIADDGTEEKVISLGFNVFSPSGSSQASLNIFPSDAPPGERITLIGNGYFPGTTFSSIGISVPGQSTPFSVDLPKTVTVKSDGSWNAEFEIPSDAPIGFYYVFVESGTDSTLRFADTELYVYPEGEDYFYIDLGVDYLDIIQGGMNEFSCPVEVQCDRDGCIGGGDLQYSLSQLPIGLTSILLDSDGGTIVTVVGTPTGNVVTGSPVFTPTPGKTEIVTAKFIAASDMPVGTYEIFLEVEEAGLSGNGEPVIITILPSGGSAFILPSPSSGSASTSTQKNTFVLKGEGFANSSPITFTFNDLSDGTSDFIVVNGPITSTGGAYSAIIQIPSLEPGSYTVKATDGATTKTTQFKISPTEVSFGLQISPRHAIAESGSTAVASVTVIPYNFNSPITLSVSGLSGFTTSFSPATFTPSKGVIAPNTLSIDTTGLPQGNYPYTVTATGGGVTISESAVLEIVNANDVALFVGPSDLILENDGSGAITTVKIVTPTGGQAVTIATNALSSDFITTPSSLSLTTNVNGFATGTITFSSLTSTTPIDVTFTATIGGESDTSIISISVFDSGTTFDPVNDIPFFDPTSISAQTPYILNVDFAGTFDPVISINSISTIGGSTTIIPTKITADATLLGTFSSELTTAAGTDYVNVEPKDPTSDSSWKLCLPIPDNPPSGLTLAFLDDNNIWQKVDSFIENGFICADSDHFSTWGSFGSSSSSGGGGGGFSPPSFTLGFADDEFPITINGNNYSLDSITDGVKTTSVKTGQHVLFKIKLFEDQGSSNIRHVALYLNRDGTNIIDHRKETAIIYDKYDGIEISNPDKLMSMYKVSISEENQKGVFTFDVVFGKEMPKSDVMLWVWDYQRNAQKLLVSGALEVTDESGLLSEDQSSNTSETPESVPQDITIDPEPLMSIDFLKGWAGFSGESISDTEFLSHVGIDGQEIPSWVKQNISRWVLDGQITQQDLVNVLEYLVN